MIQSFKEYCEDWIGLNHWHDKNGFHSTPMERKEYYKKYMDKGITIEDSYKQNIKVMKELISDNAVITEKHGVIKFIIIIKWKILQYLTN